MSDSRPQHRDAHFAERRARLRALQAPPEHEPFDWREALRFGRDLALWTMATLAGGVAFAWALGAGLDWLTAVLP